MSSIAAPPEPKFVILRTAVSCYARGQVVTRSDLARSSDGRVAFKEDWEIDANIRRLLDYRPPHIRVATPYEMDLKEVTPEDAVDQHKVLSLEDAMKKLEGQNSRMSEENVDLRNRLALAESRSVAPDPVPEAQRKTKELIDAKDTQIDNLSKENLALKARMDAQDKAIAELRAAQNTAPAAAEERQSSARRQPR
jgi:hypothetical protein